MKRVADLDQRERRRLIQQILEDYVKKHRGVSPLSATLPDQELTQALLKRLSSLNSYVGIRPEGFT